MAGKHCTIAFLPLFFLPRACVQSSAPGTRNPSAFPPRKPPDPSSAPGTLDSALGCRRTLRLGKEYSAFDLAVGRAIPSLIPFDVGQRLKERLLEQDATGLVDEAEYDAEDITAYNAEDDHPVLAGRTLPTRLLLLPASHPPLLLCPTPLRPRPESPDTGKGAPAVGQPPPQSRPPQAHRMVPSPLHSTSPSMLAPFRTPNARGWGLALRRARMSKTGMRAPTDSEPQPPHHLDTGLGGISYTQAEVDALSGTVGFMYIAWLGKLTIPILDSHRRVIALLGGTPRDEAGWKAATDGAAGLLEERLARIRLSDERLHHRRAQDSFPAIARGLSHGGGQMEPGELCNNVSNTQLTDELLADPCFQRLAGFANLLFATWPSSPAGTSPSDGTSSAASLLPAHSISGPRAICAPHLDFANLSWGWCAITALGDFDPDLGGHLILWDLRLVIRFPPGSTILLPSAIIRHSNYTAAGLFRWVRNGFKTDEDFELSASKEEQARWDAEHGRRWEEGMKMFSVIDDL
ncbi:hypothetical protein B0H14DRAFT_3447168 [Mycena olivaceomarginata]|nr:hypothetical protein B0H14DRAFT_3447168 [Mycena olivaceomarginata]